MDAESLQLDVPRPSPSTTPETIHRPPFTASQARMPTAKAAVPAEEPLEMDPEQEAEEVTRCICGNIDVQLDEDYEDTGLFVQCDKCLVWQHGFCVGLLNDSQMPETYHCELCRPDLHQIIQRSRKPRRSKFLGVDNASSPPGAHEDGEDHDMGPRKRRSTMNSRDAAYDRQLEAALLLSAQQDGASLEPPAPSISGRSSRSVHRQSPAASKRGRTPTPSPPREAANKKRRKKVVPTKKEDSVKEETPTTKKKSKKKGSNATSSNSQAESQEELTPNEVTQAEPRPKSSNSQMPAPILPFSAPNSRNVSREPTPVPNSTSGTSHRKRGSTRTAGKKSSTPSTTRAAHSSNIATVTTTTAAMPSTPSSGKLHPLSEMRKRVSAILEFVGRAQEEMTTEMAEWAVFVPESQMGCGYSLVDNKKRKEDGVWGYGYSEGGSVELIEELTGSLLRWENQFG